jgi:hypothetical protein
MLNLLLALFWFLLGVAILVWHGTTDDQALRLPFGGRHISAGWLAMALVVYNLARWWSVRSAGLQRQAAREAEARQRERDARRHEPIGEPDPNFDFTDRPPQT